MATTSELSPSERVSSSFKQLTESAAKLNAVSDELAQAIAPIDEALKKLNLGIPTWHPYEETDYEDGSFRNRYIGYAKVSGKWGLALSETTGHENYGTDSDTDWLFNDAPRFMRLEALEHLPALFDALAKAVDEAASQLQQKTQRAREFAASIASASATKNVRR